MSSNLFRLRKKKTRTPIKTWEACPSLDELRHSIQAAGGLVKLDTRRAFSKSFQDLNMDYRREGKVKGFPLLEFIEGEVFYEDRNYFRLGGDWYSVSLQYFSGVHEDFRDLIQRHLLKPQHEAYLKEKWMRYGHWSRFTFEDLAVVLGSTEKAQQLLNLLKNHALLCFMEGKLPKEKTFITARKPHVLHRRYKERILTILRQGVERFTQKSLVALKLKKETIRKIWAVRDATITVPSTGGQQFCLRNQSLYTATIVEKFPMEEERIHRFFEERVLLEHEHVLRHGYNRKYEGKEGYILGDRVFVQEMIPFDLMRIIGEKVYFYVIRSGVDHAMREMRAQMGLLAKQLHTALNGGSIANGSHLISEFYREATEYEGDDESRKVLKKQLTNLSLQQFCEILKTAYQKKEIHFVAGVLDTADTERALEREGEIKLRWNAQELKSRGVEEAQDKIQLLKDKGYVEEGLLTDRYFNAQEKNFPVPDLYALFQQYAPQILSVLAKSELLAARDEVEHQWGFRFHIVQVLRPDEAYGSLIRSSQPLSKRPEIQELEKLYAAFAEKERLGSLNIESVLAFQDRLIRFAPFVESSDIAVYQQMKQGIEGWVLKAFADLDRLYVFRLRGQLYMVHPTRGEGACALHALLGELVAGIYRFPGDDATSSERAKQLYTERLLQSLAAGDPRIQKWYCETIRGYLTTQDPSALMLFDTTPEGRQIKSGWEELEKSSSEALAIQASRQSEGCLWLPSLQKQNSPILHRIMGNVEAITDKNHPYYGKNREQMIRILQEDPTLLLNIVESDPSTFLGMVEDVMRPSILSIRQFRDQLRGALEAKKDAYVLAKPVALYYAHTVNIPAFYLNTSDIHLAAYLFDKRVQVVASRRKRIVPTEVEMNPDPSKELILIYHEGAHFSRCIETNQELPQGFEKGHVQGKRKDLEIEAIGSHRPLWKKMKQEHCMAEHMQLDSPHSVTRSP